MSQLAKSFQQYGAWRDNLAVSLTRLRRWLGDTHLLETDAARRLDLALDRLNGDRLWWLSSPSSRAASPN
jgi:hypothetical protein